MRHVRHESCNRLLGAPAGWDQSAVRCEALPVQDVKLDGKIQAVRSFWRPTELEIEALRNGACVVLDVVGSTMAPVCLTVED